MEQFRPNLKFSDELIDIIIAVVALSVGFALVLSGGVSGSGSFLAILPVAFIAVLFSFPLHEYMHKIVAQKFGAIAAFRRSDMGIIITLVTGFLGFLMGMPGATMIYTNNFTKRENGIVSLAGPLTNFALFAIFFLISFIPAVQANSTAVYVISFVLFINLWLAFVNMLPIYPLDGSKVLSWNKAAYAATMILIVVMLILINPSIGLLYSVGIVFLLAIVMSFLARGVIFRQF